LEERKPKTGESKYRLIRETKICEQARRNTEFMHYLPLVGRPLATLTLESMCNAYLERQKT